MKVSSARRLNRRSRIELALLNEPIQWIGSRPTGLQITAIVFVGTIGILILGVQPIVLAALLAEQHITLTQLGHAASVELLSMGLTAALEEYVEKFNAMGEIRLEAQLPPQSVRMSPDMEVAIFRLVQSTMLVRNEAICGVSRLATAMISARRL